MPEEPKPGEGTQPTGEEAFRVEIENLKKSNLDLTSKNEELLGRVETLQDSLDSALEEMTLRGGTPPASPEGSEGGEGEGEEGKEEGEEGKEKPKAEDLEKEIEKSIKEEEGFRTEQQEKIEEILLREEMRDLDSELQEALVKFPNASREEVLTEIEDMTDEEAETADVLELSQLSHERRTLEQSEMKTKIEGDLKAQLQKEGEGGISVPQSPGAPSAPKVPAAPGPSPTSPLSQDAEWGEGLQKAKVEAGGA